MDTKNHSAASIFINDKIYREMVNHCLRKLAGDYYPDEVHEPKAFGLLGGVSDDRGIEIQSCLPLMKNFRADDDHKNFMDQAMEEHAIPSETPLDKRGWIADPKELTDCIRKLHTLNCTLIGTYHMHRVPWEHDKKRDTPTELDTVLGKNSRLIMFIISMVDPDFPILRAFSEGDVDKELPISIVSS